MVFEEIQPKIRPGLVMLSSGYPFGFLTTLVHAVATTWGSVVFYAIQRIVFALRLSGSLIDESIESILLQQQWRCCFVRGKWFQCWVVSLSQVRLLLWHLVSAVVHLRPVSLIGSWIGSSALKTSGYDRISITIWEKTATRRWVDTFI